MQKLKHLVTGDPKIKEKISDNEVTNLNAGSKLQIQPLQIRG